MSNPPSYSAVRTTLRILAEKGHVVHRQDGPRYVYRPSVKLERAREAALKGVVGTFFSGSVEDAVAALLRLEDGALPGETIDRLVAQIENARKEGR
jgi:predicted transcriptional regulator